MKKPVLFIILFICSFFLYSQETANTEFLLPKGSGFITPTFSLMQSSTTNSQVLGVKIDERYKLDYSVNFNWGYFLKKDFSIGLQLSYNNSREDITYYPENIYTVSNYYANMIYLTPNIRNYFGAGKFKAFAQTNLGFAYGQGIRRTYAEGNDSKTDYERMEVTVAVQPGIAIFVAGFVSLEVSINLIGFTSTIEKSTLNNTSESIRKTNKIDFDINILSMQIGLAFYFNTKKYGDRRPKN